MKKIAVFISVFLVLNCQSAAPASDSAIKVVSSDGK
jgi:hypothetical protein